MWRSSMVGCGMHAVLSVRMATLVKLPSLKGKGIISLVDQFKDGGCHVRDILQLCDELPSELRVTHY